MDKFIITKLSKIKNFEFATLALMNDSIDNCFHDLEKELSRKQLSGRFIIDLIVSRGVNRQRFVSAFFNGSSFESTSIQVVTSVSHEVKSICNTYFKDNPSSFNNSVLTKSQKFLLLKGRI